MLCNLGFHITGGIYCRSIRISTNENDQKDNGDVRYSFQDEAKAIESTFPRGVG